MGDLYGFTYYGDLLGVGAAYNLGPEVAYRKLNAFYNTAFARFEPLCNQLRPTIHVQMFSDSLVIWGEGPERVLQPLQETYLDLLSKGLMLRGALVSGALEKEPRMEAKGFRKFLPLNDTLARAVGLEGTVKGARLLIESDLARKLLVNIPDWLTLEGYLANVHPEVPEASMLRRICPAPSGTSYELLYFWSSLNRTAENAEIGDQLKELAEFQEPGVAEHLRETAKVLRRGQLRQRRTEKLLSNQRIQRTG